MVVMGWCCGGKKVYRDDFPLTKSIRHPCALLRRPPSTPPFAVPPTLSSAVGVATTTLPRQIRGYSGNVPVLGAGQRSGVQRVLADN